MIIKFGYNSIKFNSNALRYIKIHLLPSQFLQRRLNECFLLVQPLPDFLRVKGATSCRSRSLTLLLGADAFLQNFEAILGVLGIHFRLVADAPDSGEDSLVADVRGLGTETCDHADALAPAKGLQCLVFNVSALKNNCSAL